MSFKDAKTAINQMVLEVLTAQGLEEKTQWENREFNPGNLVEGEAVDAYDVTGAGSSEVYGRYVRNGNSADGRPVYTQYVDGVATHNIWGAFNIVWILSDGPIEVFFPSNYYQTSDSSVGTAETPPNGDWGAGAAFGGEWVPPLPTTLPVIAQSTPGVWTSVEVFTDTPNVVTLGKGGSDRMVGYVSIMYSTATNRGTGGLDDLVTQARQLLPAGKSRVVNGTKVTITGVGSEAGSTVDSWFTRPLNIFYRTDLARATF